jgi:hypothetical protein
MAWVKVSAEGRAAFPDTASRLGTGGGVGACNIHQPVTFTWNLKPGTSSRGFAAIPHWLRLLLQSEVEVLVHQDIRALRYLLRRR